MTDTPAITEPLEAHPIEGATEGGPEPVVKIHPGTDAQWEAYKQFEQARQAIVEEPIVEEIIDSELEDDGTPLINKVGHVVAAPVKGLVHGVNHVFDRFVIRLERTNDVRRGRKAFAAAQRKALADMGRSMRHDSQKS